jgi:hypothetical protein
VLRRTDDLRRSRRTAKVTGVTKSIPQSGAAPRQIPLAHNVHRVAHFPLRPYSRIFHKPNEINRLAGVPTLAPRVQFSKCLRLTRQAGVLF